jgi:hypothetical protein
MADRAPEVAEAAGAVGTAPAATLRPAARKRASITRQLDHPHLKNKVGLTLWLPAEAVASWSGAGEAGRRGGPSNTLLSIAQNSHSHIQAGAPESGSLWAPVIVKGDPSSTYHAYQLLSNAVDGEVDDGVMDFYIHPRRLAAFVGRGGSTLKRVGADTGVRIYVPTASSSSSSGSSSNRVGTAAPTWSDDHVLLEGEVESVFTALALFVDAVYGVKAIIHDVAPKQQGQGPRLGQAQQSPPQQQQQSARQTAPAPQASVAEIQQRFEVLLARSKAIVGLTGKPLSALKDILKITGTKASIEMPVVPDGAASNAQDGSAAEQVPTTVPTEPATIIISGPEKSVTLAVEAISEVYEQGGVGKVLQSLKQKFPKSQPQHAAVGGGTSTSSSGGAGGGGGGSSGGKNLQHRGGRKKKQGGGGTGPPLPS